MTRWIFVRHGESHANQQGWLAGHIDTLLTSKGEQQAQALQTAFASLHLDAAYCSDLQRARETARLALANHPAIAKPDRTLRERHLGEWEGERVADLRDQNKMQTLLQWEGCPPGGESQQQVARRILTWMARQKPLDTVALFVHGGIIRSITGLIDGLPLSEIGKRKVSNAVLIERTLERDRLEQLLSLPAVRGQDGTHC